MSSHASRYATSIVARNIRHARKERGWTQRDLAAALAEFHRRQRRFGGLPEPQAVAR